MAPTRTRTSHTAAKQPKRPPNRFILFRQWVTKQPFFPTSLKGMPDVSKYVGQLWVGLSSEDKQYWAAEAEAAKAAHYARYPDYKYRPRTQAQKAQEKEAAAAAKKAEKEKKAAEKKAAKKMAAEKKATEKEAAKAKTKGKARPNAMLEADEEFNSWPAVPLAPGASATLDHGLHVPAAFQEATPQDEFWSVTNSYGLDNVAIDSIFGEIIREAMFLQEHDLCANLASSSVQSEPTHGFPAQAAAAAAAAVAPAASAVSASSSSSAAPSFSTAPSTGSLLAELYGPLPEALALPLHPDLDSPSTAGHWSSDGSSAGPSTPAGSTGFGGWVWPQ